MSPKPNNDTLAEMLEGTRDALEKALVKIAKLEVEKSELANRVLIHLHRTETTTAEIKRLRAIIIRAKDALLDGQDAQWVHDLLVTGLLEPKP